MPGSGYTTGTARRRLARGAQIPAMSHVSEYREEQSMSSFSVAATTQPAHTGRSHRRPLLALTTSALIAMVVGPRASAAKNDGKKARKQARQKCLRQVEQCRAAVVRGCEGLADCEALFLPCCESFSNCDANSAFACLFPVEPIAEST
jgi:hypothetical protein